MSEVSRNAGLRWNVLRGRRICRMVVYAVSSISEDVFQCPTAGVKWGFCKEEDVWRMVIKNGYYVREGGAVSARLLRVERENC